MVTTLPGPSLVGGGTSGLQGLAAFGLVTGIIGTGLSAIGAYYGVQAQRYSLRSQALDLEFRGSMADLNARVAEQDADAILQAGKQEKGLVTLRYGQQKATSRARAAAAGVQAGVGSAAEIQTSIEAAKELDALTIERNALRAAGAARFRGVNFRNEALLSRVSAGNLRRFANSMSPGLASLTSLIGGAGQVSSQFLASQALVQNQYR